MGSARVARGEATGGAAAVAVPGMDLLEEIGRGATTVVHRARPHHAGAVDVAVKILRERSDDAAEVAATYRREAALLARVSHPGVAGVHAAGQVGGHPYLVLELVDGVALADLLDDGPLDDARTLRIAADVAGALAAVHRMRLVHRDVKPQNLLVDSGGHATLIDFDLATWAGALADDTVAGTLVYSAPEQNGMLARPVDARADLYALGVVLFECITGSPPFRAPDVGELLRLHAVAPAPDIRELRPGCAPALAAIVAKLLAKDPDDRYQSADGLLADLRRAAEPAAPWPFALDTAVSHEVAGPALVGRDGELGQLLQAWSAALRGDGGGLLVEGAAGAGKSRLVHELLHTVSARGGSALWTTCSDGHVPLHALRSAVERHLAAVQRRPAARREAAEQHMRQAARATAPLLAELSPALAAVLGTQPRRTADDDGSDEDRHAQVATAIAEFLTELARMEEGLLLVLDDAQQLDTASARVLRHLAEAWASVPLLVVLATTARDGRLADELGIATEARVALAPLTPAAVADLVAGELGGAQVPPQIIAQLATRTDGNPFAVLEYVRHLIDSGALQPHWGSWALDAALLDRLRLPSDLLDLLLMRVEAISAPTRLLLAAAAVQGQHFDVAVATAASGASADFVDAVATASHQRIIEHVEGDTHAFVHVHVRDALLDDLDWTTLGDLHARTAEALEALEARAHAPERVFRIAQHRMASGDGDGAATYAACSAAGTVALAQHAPVQAIHYFAGAEQAARRAGIVPDVDFRRAYGTALLRSGDFPGARRQLDQALAVADDGLTRAALLELQAKALTNQGEGDAAIALVRRALAELGAPLPRSTPLLALSSLLRALAGVLVGVSRPGRATGEQRERGLREVSLCDTGTHAATLAADVRHLALLPLRGLLPANRSGRSRPRTRLLAALGIGLAAAGATGLGARVCAAAGREAAAIADTGLVAMASALGAVVEMMRSSSDQPLLDHMREQGRWLDHTDLQLHVAMLVPLLIDDGHTAAAGEWVEHARSRLRLSGAEHHAFMVRCLVSAVEAARGRPVAAAATLREACEEQGTALTARQEVYATRARLTVLTEEGELGGALDDVVARVDALGVTDVSGTTMAIDRAVAHARLAQAQAASGDERARRLAQAQPHLRRLRRDRGNARYRAARHGLQAWATLLAGRPRAALRRLNRAYRHADGTDAPAALFELLCVHARILAALGRDQHARQRALLALSTAQQRGWEHRARRVREEFALGERAHTTSSGALRSGAGTSSSSDARHRRRIEALQQVSATAASVLDPEELIRVALDATMRLLSAERVFLFLARAGPDGETLQPHRGCDAAGNDLQVLTDYSSTLVQRVHDTGEALVVTGSEQGAALGSQSAVVHGLRSILVAPLQLKGRQLGVVYLDSRVARGVFTADDVDMLVTITHQIAASLETTRAAQLESEVHAAQRERDLAETLQRSLVHLNETLDPDEVLRRLLHIVVRTLPASQGLLLLRRPERLVLAARQSPTSEAPPVPCDGPALPLRSHPTLLAMSRSTRPLSVDGRAYASALPPELAQPLGEPRSWLALPIILGEQRVGVVVVGSERPDSYTDVELKVAAVLGNQGAAAYDRAQLYSQAHTAATVDELTEVATRRHFWELAEQHHASALRYGRPLAAIMLDIDHFKSVNDTHGHAAGDAVLREVARRIRDTVRRSDVVGRYGGEEFAILLPETSEVGPLAERLRAVVAGSAITFGDDTISVTTSIGVSYLQAGDNLDDLLARADAALYRSKHAGRDRVSVA